MRAVTARRLRAIPAITIATLLAASAMAGAPSAAYLNLQELALVVRGSTQGWNVTHNRLRWRGVKGDGTDRHPEPGDTVAAQYIGNLVDDAKFYSSFDRNKPATFSLGNFLPVWQEKLQVTGVGDVLEMAIPSKLYYVAQDKGAIPAGATLLSSIQSLTVNAPLSAKGE
ncbi:FKBP-type peptidyl-prolyl cis-trans isomerase [Sphingomonas sp. CLY1604]|uniref:FKBP-type peptidyl-prolyl cis-trans isomerase n=1 Tax=Sphingomonas sp. CLY1604 TaxID=3457786 RepID=UPI003FD88F79